MGRAAQGVTLINLGKGEKLSGLEKVVETDDNEAGVDGAEVEVVEADGSETDNAAGDTQQNGGDETSIDEEK